MLVLDKMIRWPHFIAISILEFIVVTDYFGYLLYLSQSNDYMFTNLTNRGYDRFIVNRGYDRFIVNRDNLKSHFPASPVNEHPDNQTSLYNNLIKR